MTIEDELGHFLVLRVFFEEAFSNEKSAHHDDCFRFFASHNQVILLVRAFNPKLKTGWFFVLDSVALQSMIMACVCSLLDLHLNKRKPYRLVVILDELDRIDRIGSVVDGWTGKDGLGPVLFALKLNA